jgi:hypothetical protein
MQLGEGQNFCVFFARGGCEKGCQGAGRTRGRRKRGLAREGAAKVISVLSEDCTPALCACARLFTWPRRRDPNDRCWLWTCRVDMRFGSADPRWEHATKKTTRKWVAKGKQKFTRLSANKALVCSFQTALTTTQQSFTVSRIPMEREAVKTRTFPI